MTPNTRNTTVKLTFDADVTKAGRAVEDLRRQTERLDKSTRDAQLQQQRLMQGGMGRGMPGGGSPNAVGGTGFIGSGLGIAAVAFGAERALNSLGTAIQVFSNKVGTTTQKLGAAIDSFFEGIPVVSSFYGVGKGIGQAIQSYNTQDAQRNLEETQKRLSIQGALSGPMLERDQRLRDLGLMRTGANTNLASFYAQRGGYYGQFTKAPGQLSQSLKESGRTLYDNYLTQQALGYGSAIGSPLLQAGGAALDFLTGAKRGLQDPRITNAEMARDALREQMRGPRSELNTLMGTERQLQEERQRILGDLAKLKSSPSPHSQPRPLPKMRGLPEGSRLKRYSDLGRQFYGEQLDRFGGPKIDPNRPIPFEGPSIQPQDRQRNELEIDRKRGELLLKNKELEKAITDIRCIEGSKASY
jgi:hypothetical protein